MTTEQGNKLIAEFMGEKIIGNGIEVKSNAFGSGTKTIHSFEYHSSWDWLMPVVEKIAANSPDHEWDIDMGKTFCSVYLRNLDDGRYLYGVYGSDDKPLPAIYQAVIQFIEWYNKTSKAHE
jgi:hypothetical protein